MLAELKKHFVAYFFLVILLGAFAVAFFMFNSDKTIQRLLIGALTVVYFSWGIISHVKTKRMTGFVVQEYATVALLGALLLLLLTF